MTIEIFMLVVFVSFAVEILRTGRDRRSLTLALFPFLANLVGCGTIKRSTTTSEGQASIGIDVGWAPWITPAIQANNPSWVRIMLARSPKTGTTAQQVAALDNAHAQGVKVLITFGGDTWPAPENEPGPDFREWSQTKITALQDADAWELWNELDCKGGKTLDASGYITGWQSWGAPVLKQLRNDILSVSPSATILSPSSCRLDPRPLWDYLVANNVQFDVTSLHYNNCSDYTGNLPYPLEEQLKIAPGKTRWITEGSWLPPSVCLPHGAPGFTREQSDANICSALKTLGSDSVFMVEEPYKLAYPAPNCP